MEGRSIANTANLGVRGVQVQGTRAWEPAIVAAICDALIDEFIVRPSGPRPRFHLRVFRPASIAKLLGLPADDLPTFRQRGGALINYTVKYERAFEASAR